MARKGVGTMPTDRMIIVLAATSLLACGLAGCLKRKETITVTRQGGIVVSLEYEADSLDEVKQGDAMPSTEAGWQVEHTVEVEDNGEETHTLTAQRTFPPGADLPQNLAPQGDPHADLYLQFPTTLTVERRPDGAYYHFYRAYTPRPWAQIEAKRTELEEALGDEFEKIKNKEPAELTHQDRVTLIKTLVYMELVKMRAFSRWAFLDTFPNAAQDGWLHLATELKLLAEALDLDHLAELAVGADDQENSAALEAEAAAFQAAAEQSMRSTLLNDRGCPLTEVDAFMKRYFWHQKRYEITEDLGDEQFEITVEMPGRIVAANADHYDEGRARWEFGGEMLRDRIVELMVTSRVAD